MMNWKERFKPDNNAEKSLYIGILIVGGVSILISFGDKLGVPEAIIVDAVLFSIIVFVIARRIYHQIKTKYIISRTKNVLVSGVWATILLFVGIVILGFSAILVGVFSPFLPNWIVTILWFGGLILLGIKSPSIVNPIQKFILERILKLPPTETI